MLSLTDSCKSIETNSFEFSENVAYLNYFSGNHQFSSRHIFCIDYIQTNIFQQRWPPARLRETLICFVSSLVVT